MTDQRTVKHTYKAVTLDTQATDKRRVPLRMLILLHVAEDVLELAAGDQLAPERQWIIDRCRHERALKAAESGIDDTACVWSELWWKGDLIAQSVYLPPTKRPVQLDW